MTLEEFKPYIIEVFKKVYFRNTLKRFNKKVSHRYYRAKCIIDGCNNETITQHSKLKKVSGKCISCSAKKRPYEWAFSKLKTRNKNPKFKGSYISYEDTLILMLNTHCEYCGAFLNRKPHKEKDTQSPLLIDRRDSSKGYTLNNCASACWKCNEMKRNFYSYEEFKAIITLLKTNFNW